MLRDIVRQKIHQSGKSMYQVARDAQMQQTQLKRFMRGKDLLGSSLERLCETMDVKVVDSEYAKSLCARLESFRQMWIDGVPWSDELQQTIEATMSEWNKIPDDQKPFPNFVNGERKLTESPSPVSKGR